ncbi:MAG: hypothetical protein KKE76_09020 [Gammaproteobacteria bacterium]|nr:hypothetical protein [Gammaproteobacteria bacterium]
MEPTIGIVAMFDVLGFSDLRKRLGVNQLKAHYHNLVVKQLDIAVRRLGKEYNEIFPDDLSGNGVKLSFFSDTIIIYSKNSNPFDCLIISSLCEDVLVEAFENSTPLRGALVAGELLVDGNILIGESIERAYQLEQEQVWSGVAVDESFFNNTYKHIQEIGRALKKHDKGIENIRLPKIIEYDLPIQIKHEEVRTYTTRKSDVIDWTSRSKWGTAAKAFMPSDNPHVKKIIKNTVDFEAYGKALANK